MPPEDAENPPLSVGRYRFEEFEVDVSRGELRRRGTKIKLQEKPFQLLVLLLERAGRTTTREELRQGLWPFDTFVNFDNSLKTAVNKLRQALGDSADDPKFIRTIQLQGYRFVAPVTVFEAESLPQGYEQTSRDVAIHEKAPGIPDPNVSVRKAWRGRLIVGMALLALAGALVFRFTRKEAPIPAPAAQRVVLLVLPFENLSGDPKQEYFSDGLTDEMITLLSRQFPKKLSVIARTSAMRYRGTQKPLDLISRELGAVNYVLEGTVRRSGNRVAVNAQLFRTQDQESLWAESYDSDTGDLLTIQHNVAEKIAHSLVLEVVPGNSSRAAYIPAPKAHDAYMMGLYEENRRTELSFRKSIEYFQSAIQQDTSYAPAYAELANAYLESAGWLLMRPDDALPRAKAAALRAVELDDSLAEGHAALGEAEHEYEWKWTEAEHEFQRALELSPNSVTAHRSYAEFLMHSGRTAEAVTEMQRARDLDPLSLIVNTLVGFAEYMDRKYDRAIEECRKVLELDPRFAPAHYVMAGSLLLSGHSDEAVAHMQTAKELTGGSGLMLVGLVRAYELTGRHDLALAGLKDLKARAEHEYISSYCFARIYVTMGNNTEALKMLHAAASRHDVDLMFMKIDPAFDGLHNNPEFRNLSKLIGLSE